MIKIWLDDIHNPPTYVGNMPNRMRVLNKWGREDWTWATNIEQAKTLLIAGNVEVLSCDNDLGSGWCEGYMLLNWLEEKAANEPDFPIPKYIYAHTDDPARIKSMCQTIANIRRFRNK